MRDGDEDSTARAPGPGPVYTPTPGEGEDDDGLGARLPQTPEPVSSKYEASESFFAPKPEAPEEPRTARPWSEIINPDRAVGIFFMVLCAVSLVCYFSLAASSTKLVKNLTTTVTTQEQTIRILEAANATWSAKSATLPSTGVTTPLDSATLRPHYRLSDAPVRVSDCPRGVQVRYDGISNLVLLECRP